VQEQKRQCPSDGVVAIVALVWLADVVEVAISRASAVGSAEE